MRIVVVVLCIAAVAGLLFVVLSSWLARSRPAGRWCVDTVTRPDGALAVIVRREGSDHARTVRELPAGMDSVELAGELRLAREDAQLQADELNRPA